MSKFNSPSRHIARGRLDAADNSFLNLVSTPAPGSDSEKEESSGGLRLTIERGSEEANLSGTPPRSRGTSQNTPGGDYPPVAEDDSTNVSPLSTQETLGVDVPGGNPKTQTERVMAEEDSTNVSPLSTQETLGVDVPGGNPETQLERVMAEESP